ncbi:metallophosphoesterase [Deinococcus sp. HMF7620]|uniref:Metallophosphoesterase n=1 Tax=Deinococcus arboris TaxID=2682977 RepID=A0A7C9LS63_9DEIO|nr:metallophosphoesterase [Deinococcus arboris]MVN85880.1 metallophosphoesterase [Deinococcus arboris]
MRLLHLEKRPFHRLRFLNAGKRGATETQQLPFLRGVVDTLPDGVDALVLTSDLQGVVRDWAGTSQLLGIALLNELQTLTAHGLLSPLARTGAVLAGDFYSGPGADQRGASGDVWPVWSAFASACAWVAGVQGNHDQYSRDIDDLPNAWLLDVEEIALGGLRIAGIGGVVGDPTKTARRSEEDYLAAAELVLAHSPDLLILHQAPQGGAGQRGWAALTAALRECPVPLTVCGHVHWEQPLFRLSPDQTVLNVDKRVIVLTASPHLHKSAAHTSSTA